MSMATSSLKQVDAVETPRRQSIALSNVGVRYILLTEDQRSLKGRVLHLFGAPSARFWALQNVSLRIAPGGVVGIVGSNGSGKSTLLRVMSGVIHPTVGTLAVTGQVSPLLELGGAFNFELTGRENAYLYGAIFRFSRERMDEIIPQIIAFSELGAFFDIPVKSYSSGMVARLAFSVATQLQPEILLIDEILSVGDEQFQRKSFLRIQKLIDRGSIVVMVSHNSALIEQLCNRAVHLSQGEVARDGKPREVLAQYRRESAVGG
jgi:ABC-type polysaccharide/polyol phosphate transport system ATPase subunit